MLGTNVFDENEVPSTLYINWKIVRSEVPWSWYLKSLRVMVPQVASFLNTI